MSAYKVSSAFKEKLNTLGFTAVQDSSMRYSYGVEVGSISSQLMRDYMTDTELFRAKTAFFDEYSRQLFYDLQLQKNGYIFFSKPRSANPLGVKTEFINDVSYYYYFGTQEEKEEAATALKENGLEANEQVKRYFFIDRVQRAMLGEPLQDKYFPVPRTVTSFGDEDDMAYYHYSLAVADAPSLLAVPRPTLTPPIIYLHVTDDRELSTSENCRLLPPLEADTPDYEQVRRHNDLIYLKDGIFRASLFFYDEYIHLDTEADESIADYILADGIPLREYLKNRMPLSAEERETFLRSSVVNMLMDGRYRMEAFVPTRVGTLDGPIRLGLVSELTDGDKSTLNNLQLQLFSHVGLFAAKAGRALREEKAWSKAKSLAQTERDKHYKTLLSEANAARFFAIKKR